MISKPILVTGSHRSGTTWVGRTINQHPSIHYIHEPFNLEHQNFLFNNPCKKWFYHPSDDRDVLTTNANMEKLVQKNAEPKLIKLGKLAINSLQNGWRLRSEYANTSSPFVSSIIFELEKLAYQIRNQPRFLIKDPFAVLAIEWFVNEFDFQPICLIRNPIAFVGSIKKWNWEFDATNNLSKDYIKNFLPKNLSDKLEKPNQPENLVDQGILLWNIIHYSIATDIEKHPEWCFVRQEDIARDPINNFRKIFSYINLEFTPKIEDHIIKMTTASSKEASTSDFQPRNSTESLNTWQLRLTKDETAKIVRETEEIAQKFYTINGLIFS